jgi:hypothetical protein
MNHGNLGVEHVDYVVETFHVFEILEELTRLGEQSAYRGVQ